VSDDHEAVVLRHKRVCTESVPRREVTAHPGPAATEDAEPPTVDDQTSCLKGERPIGERVVTRKAASTSSARGRSVGSTSTDLVAARTYDWTCGQAGSGESRSAKGRTGCGAPTRRAARRSERRGLLARQ
jgi:hypothetical protein